jgi:PST family polysaccharide transporter
VASAFLALTGVMEQAGTTDILIQRQRHFRRWATAVFWLSLCMSLAASLLTAAFAPVVAAVMQQPDLLGLLLVVATVPLARAPSIVPMARLSSQMRFRTIAIVSVQRMAIVTFGAIILAWLGFGPYSVIIPWPIAAIARTTSLWRISGAKIRFSPQFRRWRFLIGDSARIMSANIAQWAMRNGEYLVLGLFSTEAQTGFYYFAYGIASKPITLVATSLRTVLFPALSRMQNEPDRLLKAFMRAERMLALVGVPACLLMGGIADPLLRALFGEKWVGSIRVLEIMAVFSTLRVFNNNIATLIRATGRFGQEMAMKWVLAVAYVGSASIGAALNGAVGVAIGLTISILILAPIYFAIGVRPLGGSIFGFFHTQVRPLVVCSVALVCLRFAVDQLPVFHGRDWARLAIILAGFPLIYIPVMRIVARNEFLDLRSRLSDVLSRARPSREGSGQPGKSHALRRGSDAD